MTYHLLIATAGLALLLAGWLAVERLAAAARNRARTEAHRAEQSGAQAPRAPACAACGAPCQTGAEPPDAPYRAERPREAARPSVRIERGLGPI